VVGSDIMSSAVDTHAKDRL